VIPEGTNTFGNTKDALLYDYGNNELVFRMEDMILYGGENKGDTKIGDDKAAKC